jgi:hypothetical protein
MADDKDNVRTLRHEIDDAAAEQAKLDAEDAGRKEPETGEEEDGQLFVVEQGKRVTLANLYARSTPVEVVFKFQGRSVKGGAETGLIPFSDPELTLIVPARAGKVEIDPTYDAEGNVSKVTIRPHVRAITVYDSRSEAARRLLGIAAAA